VYDDNSHAGSRDDDDGDRSRKGQANDAPAAVHKRIGKDVGKSIFEKLPMLYPEKGNSYAFDLRSPDITKLIDMFVKLVIRGAGVMQSEQKKDEHPWMSAMRGNGFSFKAVGLTGRSMRRILYDAVHNNGLVTLDEYQDPDLNNSFDDKSYEYDGWYKDELGNGMLMQVVQPKPSEYQSMGLLCTMEGASEPGTRWRPPIYTHTVWLEKADFAHESSQSGVGHAAHGAEGMESVPQQSAQGPGESFRWDESRKQKVNRFVDECLAQASADGGKLYKSMGIMIAGVDKLDVLKVISSRIMSTGKFVPGFSSELFDDGTYRISEYGTKLDENGDTAVSAGEGIRTTIVNVIIKADVIPETKKRKKTFVARNTSVLATFFIEKSLPDFIPDPRRESMTVNGYKIHFIPLLKSKEGFEVSVEVPHYITSLMNSRVAFRKMRGMVAEYWVSPPTSYRDPDGDSLEVDEEGSGSATSKKRRGVKKLGMSMHAYETMCLMCGRLCVS
jgi:hypothetical protein